MMVMTNRSELRPSVLLFIMSGLVISSSLSSTLIPYSQNTTSSRSPQGHTSAVHPTIGHGGFIAALSEGYETTGGLHSSTGTERSSNNSQAAGTGNATGSESLLPPNDPTVRTSSSTSPPEHSTLMLRSSVGPRTQTHKQATNSTAATTTAAVPPTSHEPLSNMTQQPISHVTGTKAFASTKQASTKPQSTRNNQTPGKTTFTPSTTTTTNGGKKGHICPTEEAPKKEGIVGRCLIAIALLAGLATFFIVTTVILATKLAGSRYRNRMRLLQDTEMVCISALMNDTEHPVPKPRHPKSNGALIPSNEEEDADALTLNSFLPDTECVA